MHLNFLGTGSCFNVEEGNTSAYIMRNDELILFDCGGTVFKSLKEKGILRVVKNINVFITHTHSDHIGSLSDLIHYAYFSLKIKVKVYFPSSLQIMGLGKNKPLIEVLSTIMELMGTNKEEYNRLFTREGMWCGIEDVFIKTVRVNHTKTMDCFAYVINLEGKKIYYSGDSKELSIDTVKDNDIIYQDISIYEGKDIPHLSLKEIQKIVKDKELRKKIWLMHVESDEVREKAKKLGFNVVGENRIATPCLDRILASL